jgi:hypothetical protein
MSPAASLLHAFVQTPARTPTHDAGLRRAEEGA